MTARNYRTIRFCLAMLVLPAVDGLAQAQPAVARLRASNEQVLRLHAQAQAAPQAQAALIRAQAKAAIAGRAAALAEAIADDPAQAVSLAFSPDLLARLAAAFPDSAAQLETHGVWRGPVDYLIFDDAAMRNHRALVRMRHGQEDLEIHFAKREPPGLKSGDVLEAAGVRSGNKVASTDSTVQASTTSCSTVGEQRSVVLMVYFPGQTQPTMSKQHIWDVFFGSTGRSLDSFWREASYGKTWASGDVHGWLMLDAVYSCDQYYQMRDAAIRAADPAVDFRNYNRVFLVFPPSGGCSWAGLANLGCTAMSSADGSFQASTAWLVANYMSNRDQAVQLTTHEAGHNLTLGHASSRAFNGEALGPVGVSGTLSEYGDKFNTMGSWNLGHYSAPHKLRLNWLAPTTSIRTVESSGAFTLEPITTNPAGVQALKIRRGTEKNAWLWLEYRQPQGDYDTSLSSQVFTGALIHYDDGTAGSKTHLLDFTPATTSFNDPALAGGKSWADPYSNLSVHVQSASTGGLNVNVEYGALPCVSANPTVSASPSNPSIYPGGTAAYTVTVKNNDSSGCAPSSFNLNSSLPSGWATSLSAASLALSPGQSGTVTMSKSAPKDTAVNTYPVDATATAGSVSGAAAASCTVMSPPPPLSVAVSVAPGPYTKNANVSITATVLSGSAPAGGAEVNFRLVNPNGGVETKAVTANSAGTAVWTWKVNPNAPKGSYSVTATAASGGQQATSEPAAFTVQ